MLKHLHEGPRGLKLHSKHERSTLSIIYIKARRLMNPFRSRAASKGYDAHRAVYGFCVCAG